MSHSTKRKVVHCVTNRINEDGTRTQYLKAFEIVNGRRVPVITRHKFEPKDKLKK